MRELLVREDDTIRTALFGDAIDALGGWDGMLGLLVKEGVLKVVVHQQGLESRVVYEIADSP